MFSRVAVAALLFLLRCEESEQGGFAEIVQDTAQVTSTTIDGGQESNTDFFNIHTPPPTKTTVATTAETPSGPYVPPPPIPPLDFDMNAIAQISSFPFARVVESADPFHKMITAQYAEKESDVEMQKCTMQKGTGEVGLDSLDTRMGTPLIKLEEVDKTKDLSGTLRHHTIIMEPAFPSRLYCETTQSPKNLHPTEFYHLQGYNNPTVPYLAALTPISFTQLYSADFPLPVDSILPLGAWADPQYSFIRRLSDWKDFNHLEVAQAEKHKSSFVSDHPLRLSSIDRFLLNGVPSDARNLLTGFSADGAVRILSSPLPTGNARPRHLTLACAQMQSSAAIATDSITHVEFISTDVKEKEHETQHQPEYAEESTEKWKNEALSGVTNLPGGYKFIDWEVYNETQFKSKAAISSTFNLHLFVHFSPFSCCSSCCCSREQCGKKFATGQKQCYDLDSTKTRIGHLVVQKVDRGKDVTIPDTIAEGLKQFNALLSQEPFATTGLSIYSQRFRHPDWITIQKKLLDPTAGFGKVIGLSHTPRFVDTVKCVDEENDCDNWAKCRGFDIPKVPVTPDDEDPDVPSTKCVPANIKGLKEIKLEAETNNIKLKEGDAVRIVPTTLKGSKVRWTVDSKEVEMMDETKSCDQQDNEFVDTNGRDLIIQSVTPQTAESLIEAKTATASAKITVEVERKSWWKDNKIYFILAIVLVVLVIIGVCVFCCWWKCFRGKGYCKRGKSSRTEGGSTKTSNKRTGKTSKKDSKEGEECNSTSDKELTQNPGSSARPAWRIEQKETKDEKKKDSNELTKKVTARLSAIAPPPPGDDFFATPGERQKTDANAPVPGTPGQKDANAVVTDQQQAGAVKWDDGLKTERLSGPIGNQVFGISSIPAPGEAAAAPAASPDHPAAAAAAAAVPAVKTSKESEKDEEKSSSKSSTKSDRKGDVKSPEKKGDKKDKKKDGKKDSKKKDGKKDKKKSDKKDSSKKKTTKKSPKKDSVKPKKSVKKSVTHKKKK